jgi:AcrR family transcriptional regulator
MLTHAQSERRRSVLSAARALASKGGYEAVTITAVAARAGVSRSTLYHYFGSKGHLLAELTLVETAELSANFDAKPPAGDTPAERVGVVLERIVDWALQKPSLFEALVSAWTSSDASYTGVQQTVNTNMLNQFTSGFGEEGLAKSPEVALLLEHVIFSCLVRLNRGLTTRDEAVSDLRLAARLLLR